MRLRRMTILLVLCLVLCSAGSGFAGFRIVGETTGFQYNILWKKWFEVPLLVYVDERELFYIAGGSVVRATAVFPKNTRADILSLLDMGLGDVEQARDTGTGRKGELGSVKVALDEEAKHYNGIDVYLATDRTNQSIDVYVKIYDYINPQAVTELNLALNQVRELIAMLRQVPKTIEFLKKDEALMSNTRQLDLGKKPEDDKLDQLNKVKF